jgi:hypothetical protein
LQRVSAGPGAERSSGIMVTDLPPHAINYSWPKGQLTGKVHESTEIAYRTSVPDFCPRGMPAKKWV